MTAYLRLPNPNRIHKLLLLFDDFFTRLLDGRRSGWVVVFSSSTIRVLIDDRFRLFFLSLPDAVCGGGSSGDKRLPITAGFILSNSYVASKSLLLPLPISVHVPQMIA